MKIVIEVIATGEEAEKMRRDRDEWDDLRADDGHTFWILRENGKLQAVYLQLREATAIPVGSVVRVTSE